jgi:hypothetical protein
VCSGAQSPRPDARLGVALAGSSAMETWNHWQKDGLGGSAIAPLHQNLHKQAGKSVLTRTVVGSAVVLSVEEGNDGERGWRRCPAAAQARGRHKELMRTLGRQ